MNTYNAPTINVRVIKRLFLVMLAALLVVGTAPMLFVGRASAVRAQMSERSIQLSDSGASGNGITPGTVGSGTSVTYRFSFTVSNVAQSMIVDFCSNDPIIGDTCTAPTGMNVSGATLNASATTGNVSTGNAWQLTPTHSAGVTEQLFIFNTNPGTNDMGVGAQIFDVTGMTNPSTTGSFYARMYTFANNSHGTYTGPEEGGGTTVGNYLDYGGIALSTAAVITITARVQETLTFCVSKADPNTWTGVGTAGTCADPAVSDPTTGVPAVTLGHGTGTPIIDDTTVDQGFVWTQLSTNAVNGSVVNMHSNRTCGGLSADGGSTCNIPPVNSGTGVSGGTAITNGPTNSAFGLNVEPYTSATAPAGQLGSITPASFYFNASHNTVPTDLWYGMDSTSSSAALGGTLRSYQGGVNTTFGSNIMTTPGPVFAADAELIFAATAAVATPAGIYTANLSLIATGTF